MDYTEEVRSFYDEDAKLEWERFDRHPAEFEMTKRFMARYIKPGQSVLDIGGGPGRYSIHLAKLGCEVTLIDLSQGNVDFALAKAKEEGVKINAVQGDARYADKLVSGLYDHVFIMGPLYHLLERADRETAVRSCLKLLKPGGLIYASFISMIGGIIFCMREAPELLGDNELEIDYMNAFADNRDWAGHAFTKAYFTRWQDAEPFMAGFGLEKVHLFGQEGLMAPCGPTIFAQPPEIVNRWLDLSEKVCEREDLISFSEHIMYIGTVRK